MASALKVSSLDQYGVARKSFAPTLESINADLALFQREYGGVLPGNAAISLKRFLEANWSAASGQAAIDVQAIVPFAVFRNEFDYLLVDNEASARCQIELAFEHLIRTIAVDEIVRSRWASAAQVHETKCEQLGAIHLLSHGIWAFKASGQGAATDLVFPEPLADRSDVVQRTARVLVLTEWKLVKEPKEVESKALAARTQARLYSDGLLNDLLLKGTRYIVLVSLQTVEPPPDIEIDGVLYTHFMIGLDGAPPSKAARRRGAS